jgi:hypothetical protein
VILAQLLINFNGSLLKNELRVINGILWGKIVLFLELGTLWLKKDMELDEIKYLYLLLYYHYGVFFNSYWKVKKATGELIKN